MRNREVPRKLNIAVRCAFGFAINGALQSLCVPGHHAVRHEREGSGSSNQLLRSQAAFRRLRLRSDLPLQPLMAVIATGVGGRPAVPA
jgi:hypothetical protein